MLNGRTPNVLLITCDCLRADVVGCCAGPGAISLTPNLDRLGRDGVTFRKAVSQGFRTPIAMPALFTGRYPSRLQWFAIPSPFAMRKEVRGVMLGQERTIAEILAERGYETAGFHSNPLLSRLFGYHRGFQVFDDDLFLEDTLLPGVIKRWGYRLPLLVRGVSHLPADAINRKALAWLRRRSGPFFLWLHYMDTHGPYETKAGTAYHRRIRAQFLYQRAVSNPASITDQECHRLRTAYAEEAQYLDDRLGDLFGELEKMGVMDDTLVVVTADHGEEFREHGRFNHHSTLYEELLRVPLLMKLPGGGTGGRTVDVPVGLIQVAPTIVDLLGIDAKEPWDGESLRPLIDEVPGVAGQEWLISEARAMPNFKASIRMGAWKLIVDAAKGKRELFAMDEDPREQWNVFDERRDLGTELELRLVQELAQISSTEQHLEPLAGGVSPEVMARLRDLGYL